MIHRSHPPRRWRSKFLKRLPACQHVSFDVFDTCLCRKVWHPLDVFQLVEANMRRGHGAIAAGFAEERRISEHTRRKRNWEAGIRDVTLAEIYTELKVRNPHWQDLADALCQAELAMERQLLTVRPDVLELARMADAEGKDVYYISDMYLPTAFVTEVLHGAGYPRAGNTIVSAEAGETKHEGSLYDWVAAKHALKPGHWLHLGDNAHADYRQARKRGIRAILLPTAADLLRSDPHISRIMSHGRKPPETGIARSILYGSLAARKAMHSGEKHISGTTFWEDFGYRYAGPLMLGFTAWVAREARRLDLQKLFFLSRDGKIVQQIYEQITSGRSEFPQAAYLLTSRRAVALPALEKIDDQALYLLTASQAPLAAADYLTRLGLDATKYQSQIARAGLADTPPQVPDKATRKKLALLFHMLEADILEQARRERRAYLRYLESSGFTAGKRSGLVDVGWHGTIQSALLDLLPQRPELCRGFYFASHAHARPEAAFDSFLYHRGHPPERTATICHGIELIEFMFLSPEPSFLGMEERPDGSLQPILDPLPGPQESYGTTRSLHAGAMAFTHDFSQLADPLEYAPDADFAYELLHRLVCKPTQSLIKHIGEVRFWEGFGTHTVPIPLADSLAAAEILLRPMHSARKIKRSLWPPATLRRLTPPARLWLWPWLKLLKYPF